MKFHAKLKNFMVVTAVMAMFVMVAAVVAPQSAFAQESDRKVKTKVNPVYPELARQTHISGSVKVEATIAPSGAVTNVRLIGGHPVLAGAAEDALRKWKYEPSSSETTTVVEFKFNPGM